MNYNLMPSLGHIALVKTGVSLWNQHDIKTEIKSYSSSLPRNKMGPLQSGGIDWVERCQWYTIERKVLNNVTQLSIPECLKEKLSGVVRPIGLELINCMAYHYQHVNGKSCQLPDNFHWTSVGKVDKMKTAAALIKDDNMHIADRFILACNHCLQDDMNKLWKSMTGSMKTYICGGEYDLNYEVILSDQLVVLWTYAFRGHLAKLNDKLRLLQMSPCQLGFKIATSTGNKPATEYFFKRLNPVEREKCLMEYKCKTCYSDVLCFLLSQMNEKEQITFLSKNAYQVLSCLLEWPLQSFFIETFVRVCKLNFLQGKEFYALLRIIMNKIEEGRPFTNFNYNELFEQVWLLSPYICKEYVICDWAESEYITLMLDMAFEENVMLILNDATIQEREKIIFNNVDCLVSLVYNECWDTLKLLIQECVSSTEMMLKLKNQFVAEYKLSDEDGFLDTEIIEKHVSQINQLMDELISKKRSIEEDECSRAKRPRTIDKRENDMGM